MRRRIVIASLVLAGSMAALGCAERKKEEPAAQPPPAPPPPHPEAIPAATVQPTTMKVMKAIPLDKPGVMLPGKPPPPGAPDPAASASANK